MNFTLTVSYDEGAPDTVSTKPVDGIHFERKFHVPITQVGESFVESDEVSEKTGQPVMKPGPDFRMEWIWYMAYLAVKRKKPDTPDFDEWAEHVEAIDAEPGGEPPLAQSPSTGN